MRIKKRKTMPTLLLAAIVLLLLPGLACNLFSAQPDEPEVVEEPVVVEDPEVIEEPEPEDEPAFRPEQALRLDFEDTVRSVVFNSNGSLFGTGIFMQVDVWNTSDGTLQLSLDDLTHRADGLAFSPADQDLFVALGVGGVNMYNLGDGELVLDFHGGYDSYLALSPDGTRIATGNRSGLTWLWDTNTGEQIFEMDPADYVEGYSEWLTAMAFSPDGSLVAAGHYDGMIFIWNAATGELERLIEPETDRCTAWGLAFSPDGEIIAMGGARLGFDEVVRLWQVSDGGLVGDLEHGSRVGSRDAPVAFSPDGTLLAAGTTDGIYIWALPDYELLHTIPIEDTGESDWVTDLAFSPDSQFLLAGYWDNYATLWQVQE